MCMYICVYISVQFSHSIMSDSLWPCGLQPVSLPCPSPTFRAWSSSCPLNQWCQPTISFSVVPFSSCLQSFPASGSFPMSHLFISSGQSIGASASESVLPMNIQDWVPLGWTGWISFQSKGLSKVFSNATVQKHQILQCTYINISQISPLLPAQSETNVPITRILFVLDIFKIYFNYLFCVSYVCVYIYIYVYMSIHCLKSRAYLYYMFTNIKLYVNI